MATQYIKNVKMHEKNFFLIIGEKGDGIMALFGQGVATPVTGTQPNFSKDMNKKI